MKGNKMLYALLSLVSILCSPACAIAATGATPAALSEAKPEAERTAIPRDRHPDFSAFRFMLGTWNCTVASSRRPRTFSAQSTTRLSSDGYWIVTTTTTPPVPWNKIRLSARDFITYDSTRSLWVDLTMDNYGLYGVSTSNGWKGGMLAWNDVLFPKSHATSVHLPRVVTEISDRSMSTVQRFREPSGRGFVVTTTCEKI